MKLVVVESPFSGDVSRNLKYARLCLADCLERGEAPFASHLLYTQSCVLDDNIPEERELGIKAGFEWNKHAQLSAVYTDFGVSGGMKLGIKNAEENARQIEYRKLFDTELVIDKLSKHAIFNSTELNRSALCACYYCRTTFTPSSIEKWTDVIRQQQHREKTAICPYCSIDAVYGDASGYPMNEKFLKLAYKWYFCGSSETF